MASIIVISTLPLVACSPIANYTTLKEIAPSYVAQPPGRGTIGIITSSVLTLILCVWTAIHPNIIANDPAGTRALKVRIIYVLLALFAPEFVLAIAYGEWKEATDLCRWAQDNPPRKEAEKLEDSNQLNPQTSETVNGGSERGQPGGSEELSPLLDTATRRQLAEEGQDQPRVKRGRVERERFTGFPILAGASEEPFFSIECAFFAIMSGFTFPALSAHNNDQSTFTTDGLKFVMKHNLVPIEIIAGLKGEIKDKGKADTLAKILACAQALWMFINCVCRKFVGLPLTFIEVNVMIHVVCALCMYLLWLKKPNNVHKPISLVPLYGDPLIPAMLFARSRYPRQFALSDAAPANRGTDNLPAVLPMNFQDPEVYSIMENKSNLLVVGKYDKWHSDMATNILERSIKRSKRGDGVVMLIPGQSLVDLVNGFALCGFNRPNHFTAFELTILGNAAQGFRKYDINQDASDIFSGNLFIEDLKMHPWKRFTFGNYLYWTAIPLCIAYGGIHSIVWNDHFPTEVERQLWRASCIIIASPNLCICVRNIGWWLRYESGWWLHSKFGWGPRYRLHSWPQIWHKAFDKFVKVFFFELEDEYNIDLGTSFFISAFFIGVGLMCWVETHPNSVTIPKTLFILPPSFIILRILYMVSLDFSLREGEFFDYIWAKLVVLGNVFLTIGWCVYLAARVYLIAEAFLSLRSVQRGAYESVAWADVWPHL